MPPSQQSGLWCQEIHPLADIRHVVLQGDSRKWLWTRMCRAQAAVASGCASLFRLADDCVSWHVDSLLLNNFQAEQCADVGRLDAIACVVLISRRGNSAGPENIFLGIRRLYMDKGNNHCLCSKLYKRRQSLEEYDSLVISIHRVEVSSEKVFLELNYTFTVFKIVWNQ